MCNLRGLGDGLRERSDISSMDDDLTPILSVREGICHSFQHHSFILYDPTFPTVAVIIEFVTVADHGIHVVVTIKDEDPGLDASNVRRRCCPKEGSVRNEHIMHLV